MNANSLWNDALENASADDLARFAQLVPKTLANASAPEQEGNSRGKGLLLTKKQIIDLRKYEAAALALPFTLADVKDYLNFGADAGAGLKHEDFLRTFSATRRHAQRWSPLREAIMLTGSQLKLFAASMTLYGRDIEEVYADVRACGLLDKHNIRNLEELKRLELELGDKFPGIELESDTVSDLGYYLDQIFKRIKDNLDGVTAIKEQLASFGYDLREYILPEIKLRISLIGSNSLPADIETLKQQIDERSQQINEKNADYKNAVEKSIGAAAGMNLLGLALAIYLGVEAENIRAQRNSLYKEQEEAIETLKSKNQTLGSLTRVKHDLQGLELVAVDADIATQNLMHVWNVMHLYVKDSQDAVSRITDALSLRRFMSAFREVVKPWSQIEHDADALIAVFKEADAEYERNYRVQPRLEFYRALPSAYPAVDRQIMADSHTLMRDGAVRSKALFINWNYLPQLHDRFRDLVGNVSQSSGVLSTSALNMKVGLDGSMRRLERLEKELADASDQQEIEEIEADRAEELLRIASLVVRPVQQLASQLSAIDDRFDRRLTLGFIDDLGNEQQTVQASLARMNDERTERQNERAVINEAIEALKTGGVEAIGNDLLLTLEEVMKLGIAPPQVQLVMFAIEQLKKTLGQIGDGLRFLDMVRERDKLVEKIEALARDIETKTRVLASLKGKVEFLQNIHTLDDQRQRYVGEYQRAVEAFQSFVSQIDAGKQADDAQRSREFINHAQLFSAFLTPLALPLTAH
ncbi:alpha-xenorhabdolysin family binary toxin subunit A [Pseudomonas brassicacearum]|uniref:Alpha-xenorhabdolysin family binary toxin subunit A n=1 Tax=Pseudomonas brassicacearum TaxID=930166 RepID=A0AAJ3KWN7_9PSED|nr:alpha-xenorhabdolysin family binary toxin subunit A [Pseudomonas brassicacearum]NUT82772.1 alpha-xenorhabdolysin family binary toxin subunit A [Pseudomonas brassicacearum]